MTAMTPKAIVEYLDEYIIGQKDAKKVVAIALRNRYRRLQLPKEIQEEVMPKKYLNDWLNRCRKKQKLQEEWQK